MWQFIAAIVIVAIASFVLRPKPQTQPPAGINDIKAPTAEDGREIGVIFGCKYLRGPNVVWYGDLRTTPIKSKGGKK
jgi:hypothetical protein